jgi:hypothetical protein
MADKETTIREALAAARVARSAADARPDKLGFGPANGEAKRQQSALSLEICKGLVCPVCSRAPHLYEDDRNVQIACPNRAEHGSVVTSANAAAAREAWTMGRFDPETIKGTRDRK